MKIQNLLLLIFTLIAGSIQAQSTYNLAFITDTDPGDKLNVQINASFDVAGNLGGYNITFNYDNAVLANPVYISSIADTEPGFSTPTVTDVNALGVASLNTDFSFSDPGYALDAGVGNEKYVGIVQFDIIDNAAETTDLLFRGSELFLNTAITNAAGDAVPVGTLTNATGASLPIEIKTFTANKRGESASILDWVTATEVNSSHFEVERAMDGVSYEKLGEKNAAGLSSDFVSYQFVDANVPLKNGETTAYYRLKMVDNDGSYEYSETRSVVFDGHADVVTVHPNPTSDFITVDAELEIQQVTIYDVTGKVVFNQNYDMNKIDLSNYDSGIYKVVVSTEAGDQIKSIVKID